VWKICELFSWNIVSLIRIQYGSIKLIKQKPGEIIEIKNFDSDIWLILLEENLKKRGIVSIDNKYDRVFDLKEDNTEKLMIISHAGTMSVLISYFLNIPLYLTFLKLILN
jgi:UDP-N-acetylglucosamine transferase subunit ALG13